MVKKVPLRSRANATQKVEVRERRSKKLLAQRVSVEAKDTPVEPGEAGVSVGHGYKMWFSDRDAGMTVESSCMISLSCRQDYASLAFANEEASRLAHGFAKANMDRVKEDLDAFMEGNKV